MAAHTPRPTCTWKPPSRGGERQASLGLILSIPTPSYGEGVLCVIKGNEDYNDPGTSRHILPSNTGGNGAVLSRVGINFRAMVVNL